MPDYSWTKESRSLHKKLKKKNIKNTDEIKEEYWLNSPPNNGSKALRYTNFQFQNSTKITRIGFEKPHLNLGINWIIRIRCGFENSSRIAIASNRGNTRLHTLMSLLWSWRTIFSTLDLRMSQFQSKQN